VAVKVVCDSSSVEALQLAVLGVGGAGLYELGRIETGDALQSREAFEADALLDSELAAFAQKRLVRENSQAAFVNEIEVIRAFRKETPRHRTVEGGGASDAVVKAAFRRWYRMAYPVTGGGDSLAPRISSSGFVKELRLTAGGVEAVIR